MKRPGYREAIRWMVDNDDIEWVDETNWTEDGWIISVTAAMVADLFDVSHEKIYQDLCKELKKNAR